MKTSTGGATRDRCLAIQRDSIALPAPPAPPALPPCPACPPAPAGQQKTQNPALPAAGSRPARTARSRAMAEARTDHGCAAGSPTARSSPTSAPAAGGSRVQLARRVGPNGVVYARRHPAADARSDQSAGTARRALTNVRHRARHGDRSAAAGGPRRGADRRTRITRWRAPWAPRARIRRRS